MNLFCFIGIFQLYLSIVLFIFLLILSIHNSQELLSFSLIIPFLKIEFLPFQGCNSSSYFSVGINFNSLNLNCLLHCPDSFSFLFVLSSDSQASNLQMKSFLESIVISGSAVIFKSKPLKIDTAQCASAGLLT